MIPALCLIFTAGMLFYIVRYRVHIHIEYTPVSGRAPRQHGRQGGSATRSTSPQAAAGPRKCAGHLPAKSGAREEAPAAPLVADLTAALVGQGLKKAEARKAAERAAAHQDTDITAALKRAIDYARVAA